MATTRLEEIRDGRIAKRKQLLDAQKHPYPAEVRRTHTISEVLSSFDTLSDESTPVALLGRLRGMRKHGALMFLDLHDASAEIQLQATEEKLGADAFGELSLVDVGDWVQVTGSLIKTQRGVETVELSGLTIISKAIRPLPDDWYGLKDQETRYRQREVDLILNESVAEIFEARSAITSWLRQRLLAQNFLEVQTPILQPIAGGAAAKPFTTHHNALDMDLYLRIAPELYLKRLLVGGYEKVFEIGSNFRNEGISRQHNPEFTMLEFYWAYADYEDLMDFTQSLFFDLVKDFTDETSIPWKEETITFENPLPRKRYIDLLNELTGFDILEEEDPKAYEAVYKREGVEMPASKTYGKLVDELYKERIRPSITQPTILYDYPAKMVPLAKQSLTDPRVAEKFQLVVAGMEIVNAYTELNDPIIQQEKFNDQQAARDAGDEEAQTIDEAYIRAMEYGMPPAAGLGLGIDRLVMLLTNSQNLRDTILFPLLKPEK